MAFGIVDNGLPNRSSEQIATIKAYKRSWDFTSNAPVAYTEIKTEPCTKSELGLITAGPVDGTANSFF